MPVIQITKADQLKGRNLEEGWYSWEIRSVSAFRQNGKGKGYDFDVVFSLIDHENNDYNGKEIQRTFTTGYAGFINPLIAAVEGKKLDEIPLEDYNFNTDDLIGKKIDGRASINVYNGNQNNKVEEYAPYKSIVGKAMAF